MKTLVIGDIHGCYSELLNLLDQAALTENDPIIALGDLVDRGPDSPAVLQFFQNHSQARSLMGNHERKHIFSFRRLTQLSASQLIVKQQFSDESYLEAINFMVNFPLFLDLPESILIHGCLEPGIPLDKQQENVLAGSMSGENYLRKRYGQPWYSLYAGEKPVIAGHHDYSKMGKPIVHQNKVFLIDTGCCYGKNLTGLLLPNFQLISVKSRKNYWSLARQSHRTRS